MSRKTTNLRKRLNISEKRRKSSDRCVARMRSEIRQLHREIPDIEALVVRINRLEMRGGRVFGVQVSFDMDWILRGLWHSSNGNPHDMSMEVRRLTDQMQRQIERAVLNEIQPQMAPTA